jgi:hypothetical protein
MLKLVRKFIIFLIGITILHQQAVANQDITNSFCGKVPPLTEQYYQGYKPSDVGEDILSGLNGVRKIRGDAKACQSLNGPNALANAKEFQADPSVPGRYCEEIAPPITNSGWTTTTNIGSNNRKIPLQCDQLYFAFDSDGLVNGSARTLVHTAQHPMQAVPMYIYSMFVIVLFIPVLLGLWVFLPITADKWGWTMALSGFSPWPAPEFMYSKFRLERTNDDKFVPKYRVAQDACLIPMASNDGQCNGIDLPFSDRGWSGMGSVTAVNPYGKSVIGTTNSGATSICLAKVPRGDSYPHSK